MTRLASIRWVFQKEQVNKPNYDVPGGCSRLSVPIKIGMLDDALKMSVD